MGAAGLRKLATRCGYEYRKLKKATKGGEHGVPPRSPPCERSWAGKPDARAEAARIAAGAQELAG